MTDGKNHPTFAEVEEQISALADALELYADEIERMPLSKALVAFFRLKEGYEALDKQRKRVYAVKDKLDKVVVPKMIEDNGMEKVQVPEVARSFYVVDRVSASLLDKEKGFEWLRNNGGDELITETVNAQTLAGFVQQFILEQGMDPPEDVIKMSPYQTTGVSKYTPKEKK